MVLNPVSGKKFTGKWTPPKKQIIMQQMAEEQSAPFSTLFALTSLKQQEQPILLVSDIAANTFTKVINLDRDLFGPADGPVLAQYTAGNQAVFALSPDVWRGRRHRADQRHVRSQHRRDDPRCRASTTDLIMRAA